MSSNDDHVNRIRAMCGLEPFDRQPNPAVDRVSQRLGRDLTQSVDTTDLAKYIGGMVSGRGQVTQQSNLFEKFATVKAMTQPGMSGPSGQIGNVSLRTTSYEYPGTRRPEPAPVIAFGDPDVHLGHVGPEPVTRK